MENLYRRKNGTWEYRYLNPDADAAGKRNRTSFYMPRQIRSARDAETVATKINHLVARKSLGSEPDPAVVDWLAGLPNSFYQKFVIKGLTAARIIAASIIERDSHYPWCGVPGLQEYMDWYIEQHGCHGATRKNLELYARGLVKFFDPDKPIDSFTAADAERFRKWLSANGSEQKQYKTGLGDNTVATRIKKTKQFFQFAVKAELIDRNPFADESVSETSNDLRMVDVPAEWVEQMIVVAHDEDFRLMLALARYAGLRRHELSIQLWEYIDIPNKRMHILSTKTGKPTGKRDKEGRMFKIRMDVPICPELMPHILRAREMAPAGQPLMQPSYPREMNMDKRFAQCAARAGLQSWDKPWQNIHTRQTELLDQGYQIKIVCAWFGNSPKIAEKHYLMLKRQEFDRLVNQPTVPQSVPQTVQDYAGKPETENQGCEETPMDDAVFLRLPHPDLPLSYPART